MFAMELAEVGRLHVSAVNMNDRLEHNIMLKPAQGHSGRLGKLVDDAKFYETAMHVGNLSHYTKMGYLNSIIGLKAQGLVPGGILGKGNRRTFTASPIRRHWTDCSRIRSSVVIPIASSSSTSKR